MADTARAGVAQKQHRRPGSRIVPAIPFRLSKSQPSARPITPEGSAKDGAAQPAKPQPEPEPQATDEKQQGEQTDQHPAKAVQTPLTPESNTSGAEKRVSEAPSLDGSLQNGHPAPAHAHGELSLSATSLLEHVLNPQDAENHVNGHADEKPPTPTEPSAEPKPAVNGVHRKLTIPAHLPPPFYPSNKTDTQTPPAEGSDSAHPPLHRHQLSAGALVFQSASESPAPLMASQEPELLQHEQHSLPRPPPGFGPQQFAPFFPGHAQHPSEAGAPWQMPPQTIAPPEAAYANGSEFRPSQIPNGPTVYPGPYNGHLSPDQGAFVTNGTLTSHPQSPSKAQFGDTVPTSEHGEEHQTVPYQNGAAHPAERLEDSPFELAGYLSTQFANPDFADFILQIRSPESILVSVPVHGIVVVRSPVIAEAVRRSPAPSHRSRDARRLIDVLALDPFTTGESLQEAVRVLYGAPLLSAQSFLYGLAPYMYENDQAVPSNDARQRMRQVLSYIAAARTLQIPIMQARGVEIARMLLRWDTVEQVLQYTLQASSVSRVRGEGTDAEDPFISMLLNHALEFVAFTFPVDFKLYTIAPEFPDAPRLPTLVEARHATHNPRLSKIRFGDAPPEDDHHPSHVTVTLSTILLSLPLQLVERLFNHRATASQLGWNGAKILQDVVNERESRRQKASRGQLKPNQDGNIPSGLLNNVYLEEFVEQVEPSPLHPSGHRLATKRVTSDT
jgi:hypothetical protein